MRVRGREVSFVCFYRYYHENGLRWDMDICTRAASAGRLDCLRYVHRQGEGGIDNGDSGMVEGREEEKIRRR